MIRIDFDPAHLDDDLRAEWDAWMKRAERATRQLIQKWLAEGTLTSKDFNSAIWRDLKGWLSRHVFHGKCAYCEKLIGDDVELDGEHYRPKAGIKYKDGAPVQVEDWAGTPMEHPGYFWLAYHWKNLLPSCKSCNQGRGKMNQFPTKDRRHAYLPRLADAILEALRTEADCACSLLDLLDPETLDTEEERQLLHPYFDVPTDHLGFGAAGIEYEMSERGKLSIKVLRLHRDTLRRHRSIAQATALNTFMLNFMAHLQAIQLNPPPGLDPEGVRQEAVKRGWASVEPYTSGQQPHSAAVISYIEMTLNQRLPAD
ncbi:MAG: hypothetical protein AAF970_01595 [Bacteroidota bacterium]